MIEGAILTAFLLSWLAYMRYMVYRGEKREEARIKAWEGEYAKRAVPDED